MEHKLALGKFPIFTTEISKNDLKFSTATEIINFFKQQIDANPIVAFIGTFDHYNHTKSIGSVPPEMKDIQNIIFCFGPQIPNLDIIAVRPRSIGVTELADSFVINFMEAPGAMPNQVMQQWVSSLRK